MISSLEHHTSKQVLIVPTGSANIASVMSALRRAGADVKLCTTASEILAAPRVVLPGVGAFGAAVAALTEQGFIEPIRQRLATGKPTLAICLGMQLMLQSSDESSGVAGLGIIPGAVRRFAPGPWRVPHMGWAKVTTPPAFSETRFPGNVTPGEAYFAHSYYVPTSTINPQDWLISTTNYASTAFAAMLQSRKFPGIIFCQFHPELSGPWGAAIFEHWLAASPSNPHASPPLPIRPRGRHRIIPCLDVRDGRIVKGVQFSGLRDAGNPAERAMLYADEGADELVMLDVSAGPEGRQACLATIQSIRRNISIPLCVGGGVRTIDDAKAVLDAGADKVAINSAAVRDPEIIAQLAERFGRQCIVAAIDAARVPPTPTHSLHQSPRWQVVIASGKHPTSRDVVAWAAEVERLGAGEILLTSFDRDGTGSGYDLELLRAVRTVASVPIIASGGAKTPEHFAEALATGQADAVLAATIFHDGNFTPNTLRSAIELLAATQYPCTPVTLTGSDTQTSTSTLPGTQFFETNP